MSGRMTWRWALALALGALPPGCGDDVSSTGAGGATSSGGTGGTATGGGGMGGGATICETDATPGGEVAVTDRGAVQGAADGATTAFLGLPFAEPPVGGRRFAAPEPVGCYDGLLDATAFGPECVQADAMGNPTGDEDCLQLNVWTPAVDGGSRPVMVFIHGGGNIQGSASQLLFNLAPIYTGKHLAEQGDVVVVTLQYRLGPFGFLPLAELVDEANDGRSGNAAMLDQIEALRWVQRNAAAFGGDPDNVTIFGESAGGVNVCALVGSPLAAGLFHRASVHSGACVQGSHDAVVDAFSDRVDAGSCSGADRLACLRDLPAATLLEELGGGIGAFDAGFDADPAGAYGPLVDGVFLTESTDAAMLAGSHNAVPFMVGSNAEEMAGLMPQMVTTDQDYVATIQSSFMPFGQMWVDQVLATYPSSAYASPQDALWAVFGDLRFTCPTELYAQSADAGQTEGVYRYWFQRRAAGGMGPLPASHGLELLFVFGSLGDIPGFVPDPADSALSDAMIAYWTQFAATGDPNGGGAPVWPAYASDDPHIILDEPISAGTELKATECAMWEAFYASLGM